METTPEIIATVFWFLMIPFGSAIVFWSSIGVGVLIGKETGGAVGALVGWLLTGVWILISVVQFVIHLINLIVATGQQISGA